MVRRGKRKRHSMNGKDTHGMTWLSGWGNDRKLTKRIERRVRERRARKFEEGAG